MAELSDDAAPPTPRTTLGAGSVLAERYRLLRTIGEGGMGAVWEAEHLLLGSKVAIKLMSPALVEDERARGRFLREAQAAANLRGPHVVAIHDHGVHEGTPYIAMELLEGEPLSARLAARGRLPLANVVELVAQVGRAVAKAHAAGVVHRDLKPENIFLVAGERDEIAKVLDFGIAKRAHEGLSGATTGCGTVLGTPFYMSPEQLVDATLADARADLWSLAVIAYECLVGERPFTATNMAELAVAVLAEPIPVPSQHAAVPPGFDAWFERATRRDPDARFQDATTMIDALAQCAAATEIPTRASAPRRRAARVLVPSMLAAGVLVGLALAGDRREEPQTPADTRVIEASPAAATARIVASPREVVPEAVTPASPPSNPADTNAPRKRGDATSEHDEGSSPRAATERKPPVPGKLRRAAARPVSEEPKPPRQDVRELEGL